MGVLTCIFISPFLPWCGAWVFLHLFQNSELWSEDSQERSHWCRLSPFWVIASDSSRRCAKRDRQLILRFIIRLMRVTFHSDVQLHFTAVQTGVDSINCGARVHFSTWKKTQINNPFPEIAIKLNYEWLSEENISAWWKQLTQPNTKRIATKWSS